MVVACNNATAAALDELRYEFDVPLVGVIDPGVRALLSVTRTGRVGVIGTVGTIASGAYQRAVRSAPVARPGRPPGGADVRGLPGLRRTGRAGRDQRTDEALVLVERLLAPVRRPGSIRSCSDAPITLTWHAQ